MNNQILVADEVAELLRVDRQRIYELVRTDQIPVIRLGQRQYRFSRKKIESWLANGGNKLETQEGEISNNLTLSEVTK